MSSIPTPSEANAEESPPRLLTGSGHPLAGANKPLPIHSLISHEKASAETINGIISYLSPAMHIRKSHPLRAICAMVDEVLELLGWAEICWLLGPHEPKQVCCEVGRLLMAYGQNFNHRRLGYEPQNIISRLYSSLIYKALVPRCSTLFWGDLLPTCSSICSQNQRRPAPIHDRKNESPLEDQGIAFRPTGPELSKSKFQVPHLVSLRNQRIILSLDQLYRSFTENSWVEVTTAQTFCLRVIGVKGPQKEFQNVVITRQRSLWTAL